MVENKLIFHWLTFDPDTVWHAVQITPERRDQHAMFIVEPLHEVDDHSLVYGRHYRSREQLERMLAADEIREVVAA